MSQGVLESYFTDQLVSKKVYQGSGRVWSYLSKGYSFQRSNSVAHEAYVGSSRYQIYLFKGQESFALGLRFVFGQEVGVGGINVECMVYQMGHMSKEYS